MANIKEQRLLEFILSGQGKFLSSHCEIRKSKGNHLGIYAKQGIVKDTTLLQIPKSTVFSASNSSIANLLQDEEIDGPLALTIAFIYETTVFREHSHWYSYLRTIKFKDENYGYILPPPYWDNEVKKILGGTTMDTLFHCFDIEDDIHLLYEVAEELAYTWHKDFGLAIPEEYFDFNPDNKSVCKDVKHQKFVSVMYVLSSVGFEIDTFHETGLVPIADLFNHNMVNANVDFVSIHDVCAYCGELGMCKHIIAEEAEEARDMDELGAHARNLNATARGDSVIDIKLLEELEEEQFEDENGSQDSSDDEDEYDEITGKKKVDPEECVDVVTTQDIKTDQEIFISSEEIPNPLLLLKYGYTLLENPFDISHMANEVDSMNKEKTHKDRLEWWTRIGLKYFSDWYRKMRMTEETESDFEDASENEEQEEGPENDENTAEQYMFEPYLTATGEPSFILLAILNLLTMTATEWKKFMDRIQKESTLERCFLRLEASVIHSNPAKKLASTAIDYLQD